jgi:hypothetical protein
MSRGKNPEKESYRTFRADEKGARISGARRSVLWGGSILSGNRASPSADGLS